MLACHKTKWTDGTLQCGRIVIVSSGVMYKSELRREVQLPCCLKPCDTPQNCPVLKPSRNQQEQNRIAGSTWHKLGSLLTNGKVPKCRFFLNGLHQTDMIPTYPNCPSFMQQHNMSTINRSWTLASPYHMAGSWWLNMTTNIVDLLKPAIQQLNII